MDNFQNIKAERVKQFFVVIATLCVIFINYLAGSGYINDKTPEAISDKYPTLVTPAGYAFAIWSLIYLGLIGFSIYQLLPSQSNNPRFKNIRTLYIVNCAANCAWLYLWHYDWIVISLATIFVLLSTLVLININLQNIDSIEETWLAKIPFSIYFGWITIATILNFTIVLVHIDVKMPNSTAVILASVLIILATILGIVIRIKLAIATYALTFAWALTAIAVKQSDRTGIVVCAAVSVIILLITAVAPLFRKKNSYQ